MTFVLLSVNKSSWHGLTTVQTYWDFAHFLKQKPGRRWLILGRLGLFEAQKDFLSGLHYFVAQPRAPGSDVSAEVLPLGRGGWTA